MKRIIAIAILIIFTLANTQISIALENKGYITRADAVEEIIKALYNTGNDASFLFEEYYCFHPGNGGYVHFTADEELLEKGYPVLCDIYSSVNGCEFSDITDESGGMSTYIVLASAMGIVQGYDDGAFRPDKYVTYNEAIKMIVCAFTRGGPGDVYSYPADYITAAGGMGFTLGISFDGDAFIDRQALDTILLAAKEKGYAKHLKESFKPPVTADKCMQAYAKAVKDRNGAMQFALYDDELKAATRNEFVTMNWVTGVSSPWISEFDITHIEGLEYEVTFKWATSAGPSGVSTERLLLSEIDNGIMSRYQITEIVGSAFEQEPTTIAVGDMITLGEYNWSVLDVKDSRALLLSDRIIEQAAYNRYGTNSTWDKCDLRRYLNGIFYNNTFSAEEKAQIAETSVLNKNNPWSGTNGGSDTTDRIFLLSIEEVIRYFGDSGELEKAEQNEYMRRFNDEYNSARTAIDTLGNPVWWWLRSPGRLDNLVATIEYNGDIDVHGAYCYLDNNNSPDGCGVRPALWINIEKSGIKSLAGYMVIEDNTLYLDEVEIITGDNTERINELGLTEQNDYPSGYHIHHLGKGIVTYKLTDETVYNFVDYNLLFVDDADGDRKYSTTKLDEFIQHLGTSYYDSPPAQKVPFFIQVKDGAVISVTEEFAYTI